MQRRFAFRKSRMKGIIPPIHHQKTQCHESSTPISDPGL
jgi:hypothetical protein